MSLPARRLPLADVTLFLVDDDELVRCALVCLLRRRGATVRSFASAEPALEAALLDRPDLIVIDLELPGMTGFEAATALQAEPLTADVPLLALSGHVDRRTRRAALAAGADAFLAKPCDVERLVDAVAALARQGRPEREPSVAIDRRGTSRAHAAEQALIAGDPLRALLVELARAARG